MALAHPSPSRLLARLLPHLRFCSVASARSPVLHAVTAAPRRHPAVLDAHGAHTYGDLADRAAALLPHVPPSAPLALFLPPTAAFIPPLLAAWARGVPAAPLSPLFPAAALAPLLHTLSPSAIFTTHALRHALPPTNVPVIAIDELPAPDGPTPVLPEPPSANRALIFFTSGTTGQPKGVVWTPSMLSYQLRTLSAHWHWSSADHILGALPLHHIHGMVNVVLSALYNRATLELHSAFDAHSVWAAFLRDDVSTRPNVFMGVPPMYRKLLAYYDRASPRDAKAMRNAAKRARLFVCGSASLSRQDAEAWANLSGQPVLERYGMTETGMTLSNHYDPTLRRPAILGSPLPGVRVRLSEEPAGELLVSGPGVFKEYYGDPTTTAACFTEDGYFRTGDIVERVELDGVHGLRLLGRANADFVKSGGYKVSTVEIEDILADVPGVKEVSVVGVAHDVLGEEIVAAVVTDGTDDDVLQAIERVANETLPRYKVPRRFEVMADLPRNVMGKIQKQVLRLRLANR